jgi:hypothetical protein
MKTQDWGWIILLAFIFAILGYIRLAHSQEISTIVIDSAPKKLYTELYSDENGNQFLVEIYEEPQEGNDLVHFRAFKNGKLISRKSQALADGHNFTFFIDETEQKLMREDAKDVLQNVLRELMAESDRKLKNKLEKMFDQDKIAQSLSEKIKVEAPDVSIASEQISDMAKQLSEQIKSPNVSIASKQITDMAEQLSKQIKSPDVSIASKQISDMAKIISEQIVTPDDVITEMADKISEQITFDGGTVGDIAERISKQLNEKETPDEVISEMASQISKQIKTPVAQVNEADLALKLAIKLTQKENLVSKKIPPYKELLKQVTKSNQQRKYEKTIEILDEDIANRTPEEQRKALKISGIMSVLVGSKKLKRAVSTIEDFDLPDDPALRQIEEALDEWLRKHLIVD